MRLFEVNGGNTIIVMYAYSNPPTKEYKSYFEELKKLSNNSNTDYMIYFNPMTQNDVNPLSFVDVRKYTKLVYPNYNYSSSKFKNPIEIMNSLKGEYTNIVFMVTNNEEQTYNKYSVYANEFGFTTYTVKTFEDTKEYNEQARESVVKNDFVEFQQYFDSSNKIMLSNMFISLRKLMRLKESKNTVVDSKKNYEDLFEKIIKKEFGLDKFGNKFISNDNLIVVELPKIKKAKLGMVENKKALFVKRLSISECIDSFKLFESSASTTTASNVASSVSNMLGTQPNMIRREDITDIINNNDTLDSAMRYCVNKYNIINTNIIKELRTHYDNV